MEHLCKIIVLNENKQKQYCNGILIQDNIVLTCSHVFKESFKSIQVFIRNKFFEGELMCKYDIFDIGFIKIDRLLNGIVNFASKIKYRFD